MLQLLLMWIHILNPYGFWYLWVICNPWPVPVKTCTLVYGYGFWRVRARVAHDIPYSQPVESCSLLWFLSYTCWAYFFLFIPWLFDFSCDMCWRITFHFCFIIYMTFTLIVSGTCGCLLTFHFTLIGHVSTLFLSYMHLPWPLIEYALTLLLTYVYHALDMRTIVYNLVDTQ